MVIPLIGDPIGHVTGPSLFNKVFDANGINAICLPTRVEKGKIPEFIKSLKYLNCPGFILTMPHKQDILSIVDKMDDISRIFRSVNSVHIYEDGTLEGRGLDGKSAVSAICEGYDLTGKSVMMIGAGGISGVIGAELAEKGVRKLTILNRTLEKAQSVCNVLLERTNLEVACATFTAENANKTAEGADCFINATCLGMKGIAEDYEDLGFMERLPKSACVLEVITNPPETSVVQKAHALGLKTFMGMDMQAAATGIINEFVLGIKLDDSSRDVARQFYCDMFNYTRK